VTEITEKATNDITNDLHNTVGQITEDVDHIGSSLLGSVTEITEKATNDITNDLHNTVDQITEDVDHIGSSLLGSVTEVTEKMTNDNGEAIGRLGESNNQDNEYVYTSDNEIVIATTDINHQKETVGSEEIHSSHSIKFHLSKGMSDEIQRKPEQTNLETFDHDRGKPNRNDDVISFVQHDYPESEENRSNDHPSN